MSRRLTSCLPHATPFCPALDAFTQLWGWSCLYHILQPWSRTSSADNLSYYLDLHSWSSKGQCFPSSLAVHYLVLCWWAQFEIFKRSFCLGPVSSWHSWADLILGLQIHLTFASISCYSYRSLGCLSPVHLAHWVLINCLHPHPPLGSPHSE